MKRSALTRMLMVGMVVTVSSGDAFAQSRHKVIHFKPAAVVRTQWSPDAASVPSDAADPAGASSTPAANSSRADSPAVAQNEPVTLGFGLNEAPTATGRPTLQQIQNPSGGYQMTHFDFSQGEYVTPNTYMGTQFNSWNNIQMPPTGLSEFESFNRTQPPNSGWYVSPNTYVGSGFSQWSNLSTGYVTPNYLGSWNYRN